MPGTIRMSQRKARRPCISEKISPLPTYLNGSGKRNATNRKTSTAMFTHVTHPKARRYLGCMPPCSSSCTGRSGCLRDTALRGQTFRSGVGPEVGEQGRGDVGEPARGRNTAGEHEDVG